MYLIPCVIRLSLCKILWRLCLLTSDRTLDYNGFRFSLGAETVVTSALRPECWLHEHTDNLLLEPMSCCVHLSVDDVLAKALTSIGLTSTSTDPM